MRHRHFEKTKNTSEIRGREVVHQSTCNFMDQWCPVKTQQLFIRRGDINFERILILLQICLEGKSQNFLGTGHGWPVRMRRKINIPYPTRTYTVYRTVLSGIGELDLKSV